MADDNTKAKYTSSELTHTQAGPHVEIYVVNRKKRKGAKDIFAINANTKAKQTESETYTKKGDRQTINTKPMELWC